jgi:hypothetical protein
MDEIDITDSTFALNNNFEENVVISNDNSNSMYMYIIIAVGIILLGYFLYTKFGGSGKRVTFQDKLEQCYGDVCYPDQ